MSNELLHAYLSIHVWLLVSVICGTVRAQETSDIAALEAQTELEPDNVDVRLRLAFVLLWNDNLDQAEKHAKIVVQKTPEYLDAHMLLSRIALRREQYDKAMKHVDDVLKLEPENRDALLLKLDVLTWSGNLDEAERHLKFLLNFLINTSDLYYRYAQLSLEKRRVLSAYRYAKKTLKEEPQHEPAAEIIESTKRASLYVTHEFEYYGFQAEEASKDRFGYGLHMSGEAFPRALYSATLSDTVRYRYQTVNNQIGLSLKARPTKFMEVSLGGMIGAPAVVIPKGTVLIGAQIEMQKYLDASINYGLSILTWPKDSPALSHRPSFALGIRAHEKIRLGAGYSLTVLSYCDKSKDVSHGAHFDLTWIGKLHDAVFFYSWGQEKDPYLAGNIENATCEQIAQASETLPDGGLSAFRLIELQVHTVGFNLTFHVTQKLSLRGGYRFEYRLSDTSNISVPAHMANLGFVSHF